jgi:hypothetical protein
LIVASTLRSRISGVEDRRLIVPGGKRDSSKTRVAPVFDQLRLRADGWVRDLLQIVAATSQPPTTLAGLDLSFLQGFWGPIEKGLSPPVSLLSWLIRHPTPQLLAQTAGAERSRLAQGGPTTVLKALEALRTSSAPRGWHILEGETRPDVFIETPDALIVIEGKRTEGGPTLDTTWLTGRHQIWRHLDAAWEIRGRRGVLGFFVVEGEGPAGDVPEIWRNVCSEARNLSALTSSFPHRSTAERDGIAGCLLGVTTWKKLCGAFQIPFGSLPDEI